MTRFRRTKSNRETVVYVEDHFGHVIASVSDGVHTLILGLLHELVVGAVKKVLKVDQML